MSIGDGIFAAAAIWGFLRVVDIALGSRALGVLKNMESRVEGIERKLD